MALTTGIDLPGRARAAETTNGADLARAVCPLDRVVGQHATVLHRKTRHSLACRMGHVVLARSGVYVVGVAPSPGDPVATQVVGGMLSPVRTELLARGRVVNELVDAVSEHADEVTAALDAEGHEDLVVTPVLWLPGSRMPVFRSRLWVHDVVVLTTSRLRGTLSRRGPVGAAQRHRLQDVLAERFPGLA